MRWRHNALIAFDDTLPVISPTGARLHSEMLDLALAASPLDIDGGLFENTAAEIASTLASLGTNDAGASAASHVSGRVGYLPPDAQGGLLAVFAREMLQLATMLAPLIADLDTADGGQLDNAVAAARGVLASQTVTESTLPLAIDPTTDQPNRPRSGPELAATLFSSDPTYAEDGGSSISGRPA